MKRNLFLSAILPFSLAVALCACGSTPGESTPSEKTQSSVSQAQTDSAATGNEISIGNNFSIEAGTVLSDGSIYFVGREGADGFCAYVSTDDGDSWTKEELPWADQTVVGIKLRPDGFMTNAPASCAFSLTVLAAFPVFWAVLAVFPAA